MTMASSWMKSRAEVAVEARRAAGAGPAEWSGAGWIDSSWELMHGLDVVEDLSVDAWPADLPPPAPQPPKLPASR